MEYVSFFVGAGFADRSLELAREHDLAFIGADAGTIDVGPYQLAGAGSIFSDDLCRHDLHRSLVAARSMGIPMVIGSCGGAGSDAGVDRFARLVTEIADRERLRVRVARIYAGVDRDLVKQRIAAGRVHPLPGAALDYSAEQVDQSVDIVAVMGVEPFVEALRGGADVVLAGRATDSAIFAAAPVLAGYPDHVSWHAAKVAECGAAIAEPARPDLLHVTVERDGFRVAPLHPELRCTPWSVAAHQLYENADPFTFVEPSGTLDASGSVFDAVDERTVRISGGRFHPAAGHTAKLEGVEPAGHQAVAMMSYTDPVLLEAYPGWLDAARAEVDVKCRRVFGERAGQARISVRTYGAGHGSDLYAGAAKTTAPPLEAFLLIDVVAPDQALASSVANIAWHTLCHFPAPGWSGGFGTAAWPFNPPVIERGPVYRFNVNHVVELDHPLEMCRIEYQDL